MSVSYIIDKSESVALPLSIESVERIDEALGALEFMGDKPQDVVDLQRHIRAFIDEVNKCSFATTIFLTFFTCKEEISNEST